MSVQTAIIYHAAASFNLLSNVCVSSSAAVTAGGGGWFPFQPSLYFHHTQTAIYLLQNAKLAHPAFEVVLKLHELAHVVFMFHRAQQRGVDEGRAHHVNADAVVALRGRILEWDAQSCPGGQQKLPQDNYF